MKALWKGRLFFGRVQIPIKLYSAIESTSVGFNLLHAKCKAPLTYQRRCTKCHKDVPWDQVVKGVKLSDGSFFVISNENLEKLKPVVSEDIVLTEFVKEHTIPIIYFDTHYYIAPTKVTEKSYFLVRDTLQAHKVVGIARCILREKEHIVTIRPFEYGLLMSTLHYDYEIRQMSKITELSVAVTSHISKEEEKLAEQLVKKLLVPFDMSKFKDAYTEELKRKIDQYAKGKKVLAVRAIKAVKEQKIKGKSLLASLKESIEELEPKKLRKRR